MRRLPSEALAKDGRHQIFFGLLSWPAARQKRALLTNKQNIGMLNNGNFREVLWDTN